MLAAPEQTGWFGRRDHALLLTMYNSGARASEITLCLSPCNVCHGSAIKNNLRYAIRFFVILFS
jgi:site-specific recombinase XerD